MENKTIRSAEGNAAITELKFGGNQYTDYEIVGHEMKHQYDYETGRFSNTVVNGKSRDEYPTVNFENLLRKEEERKPRTDYSGVTIPQKYKKFYNLKGDKWPK